MGKRFKMRLVGGKNIRGEELHLNYDDVQISEFIFEEIEPENIEDPAKVQRVISWIFNHNCPGKNFRWDDISRNWKDLAQKLINAGLDVEKLS